MMLIKKFYEIQIANRKVIFKRELTIETRVDASTRFFSMFCVTRLLVLGLNCQKKILSKLRLLANIDLYSKIQIKNILTFFKI
ncbi:hypothetical protein BpHYR1_006754 [Brachionus plicatilis]|uniref:Uncharacterized protein n=1 Tax=Brachionus plicatilis TaxID=10195 RepID=A0A3M7RL31_BRAPC|nr:hypothetical protein BpHYR1_006754 [Brachionus plicatilis]